MEQNAQDTAGGAQGGGSLLVKIVIAVAALALIVAVSAVILNKQANTEYNAASETKLKAKIKSLEQAIEIYRGQAGKLPVSLDEFMKYRDASGKPLFERNLLDLWKNNLIYKVEGEKFKVFSAGPDMKEGTADDVYLESQK